MPTFIYSPAARVVISTANDGDIDVSGDLANGRVDLNEDAPSHASFTLINHRRKYDGIFTPDDRITLQLKRIAWMLTFSGYLDDIPYYSPYPRMVPLTATCTLKRLQMRQWDVGSQAAVDLLNTTIASNSLTNSDGGMKAVLMALLTQVAAWDNDKIHIGSIPPDWYSRVAKVGDQLAQAFPDWFGTLGGNPSIAGTSPLSSGTMTSPAAGGGTIPGTGVLPATSGTISSFAGVGTTDATGHMALSGELGTNPTDPWYIAMRWPYMGVNPATGNAKSYLTPTQENAAAGWWRNRKILVYNPKNNRAYVGRAADWGPNANLPTHRVIDVSPYALSQVLGAKTDDVVEIRFAPETSVLGPYQGPLPGQPGSGIAGPPVPGTVAPSTSSIRNATVNFAIPNLGSKLPVFSWDGLSNGNIPTSLLTPVIDPAGKQWFLHPSAAQGYNALKDAATADPGGFKINLSYTYRSLAEQQQVFANSRPGFAATPGTSNHGWGFAIDIGVLSAFNSPGYAWMKANASKYGWVHPPFSEPGGVAPEPWHWEFWAGVGADGKVPATTIQGAVAAASTPTPGSPGAIPAGLAGALIDASNWIVHPGPGVILSGPRAMMNDSPLLSYIAMVAGTSMRSFMAAPNGDFISWFPDYFGSYGTAAYMEVQDIEVMGDGFTIMWSDQHLVTHQFTAGSSMGVGSVPELIQQYSTTGIATVEFPQILEAIFNVSSDDPRAKGWMDPASIQQRFGQRMDYQPMGAITGHFAEFWYAIRLFQKSWASQFSTVIPLTFMPELYPGMLIKLPGHKFQAYVTSVSHSFDFADGGGFTTQATLIAPAATDKSALFGFPRGGL